MMSIICANVGIFFICYSSQWYDAQRRLCGRCQRLRPSIAPGSSPGLREAELALLQPPPVHTHALWHQLQDGGEPVLSPCPPELRRHEGNTTKHAARELRRGGEAYRSQALMIDIKKL